MMLTEDQNGYQAEILSQAQFEEFWPEIEKSLDRIPHVWEGYTKNYFYGAAMRGAIQVWAVGHGGSCYMILFTQLASFPAFSVLEVILAYGNDKYHIHAGDVVDAALEDFARQQGCKRIDVIGRSGWTRVLEKRGFKKMCVTLSRPVHETRTQ